MLDRTIAPPIVDAVHFNLQLQPADHYTLRNNVDVYTINAGTEAVMMVEWVFDAGNWYEAKNLQAAITNALLKSGTTTKSAFDINELFEYYGAHLNTVCYSETAIISLHCLTKHAQYLLPVVKELLVDAVFPDEEISIAINNMKQKLDVNLRKSSFVAGRLIDVYLFGAAHPYGKFSRHEDFDAITKEDIQSFYKKNYQQGSFKIFAAGILPANLEEILDTCFGDIIHNPAEQQQYPIAPATDKQYNIINDENGNQGSIRIARPFFNRHHPDFMKAMVVNTIFGGFFGSRLMENIREEKGYTYGIYSHILSHRHENAWLISTEAGKAVSAATIEEVYKEMAILREEPVDEEELLLVKNYMMGSIMADLDGPFHTIGRWKNMVLNNLPFDYFDQSIRNIKQITAADIQEIANKYLQPRDFYELVVY